MGTWLNENTYISTFKITIREEDIEEISMKVLFTMDRDEKEQFMFSDETIVQYTLYKGDLNNEVERCFINDYVLIEDNGSENYERTIEFKKVKCKQGDIFFIEIIASGIDRDYNLARSIRSFKNENYSFKNLDHLTLETNIYSSITPRNDSLLTDYDDRGNELRCSSVILANHYGVAYTLDEWGQMLGSYFDCSGPVSLSSDFDWEVYVYDDRGTDGGSTGRCTVYAEASGGGSRMSVSPSLSAYGYTQSMYLNGKSEMEPTEIVYVSASFSGTTSPEYLKTPSATLTAERGKPVQVTRESKNYWRIQWTGGQSSDDKFRLTGTAFADDYWNDMTATKDIIVKVPLNGVTISPKELILDYSNDYTGSATATPQPPGTTAPIAYSWTTPNTDIVEIVGGNTRTPTFKGITSNAEWITVTCTASLSSKSVSDTMRILVKPNMRVFDGEFKDGQPYVFDNDKMQEAKEVYTYDGTSFKKDKVQ